MPPFDPVQMHTLLTGKLQKLTADERSAMEDSIAIWGDAHILKNWDLFLAQIQYVLTL